jgi:hypothetical protein
MEFVILEWQIKENVLLDGFKGGKNIRENACIQSVWNNDASHENRRKKIN